MRRVFPRPDRFDTSPNANGQWVLPFLASESPTCFFQVDFGMKSPNANGKAYCPLSSLMGEIPGCVPALSHPGLQRPHREVALAVIRAV